MDFINAYSEKYNPETLSESQLRKLYGGARFTTIDSSDDDFVDNCGMTSYADCGRVPQGDGGWDQPDDTCDDDPVT